MARVFVITGPSGVGKGTLIRGLMQRFPELELSKKRVLRFFSAVFVRSQRNDRNAVVEAA